jgi:multidrug resistance efflux pump
MKFSPKLLYPVTAVFSFVSAIAAAQNAFSNDGITEMALESVTENPYVSLYAKRLEVARLEVQRQSRIVENERTKWVRISGLVKQGAVTRAEADAQQTAWLVAAKKLEVAKAKISKAEAFLSIARQRTDAGLDMPVCKAQE